MTELQPTRENDARVAETKHYSKAGLYGCLACDCWGCLDADCYPGAERVTVEKARELGWELTLHVFSDGNGWAKFHKPGCRPNYEEGDTPQIAVDLGALRALGVNLEDLDREPA